MTRRLKALGARLCDLTYAEMVQLSESVHAQTKSLTSPAFATALSIVGKGLSEMEEEEEET